jgi:hypothetical protein
VTGTATPQTTRSSTTETVDLTLYYCTIYIYGELYIFAVTIGEISSAGIAAVDFNAAVATRAKVEDIDESGYKLHLERVWFTEK